VTKTKTLELFALNGFGFPSEGTLVRTIQPSTLQLQAFFETKQALLAAAQDFFDRCKQCPEKILSVIGSNAKKVS
jgi:hypothetical protein